MQKLILLFTVTVLFASCHKESPANQKALPETSDQLLVKIIKTSHLSSITIDDIIDYTYDQAKNIIKEGATEYVRDNKERIVKMSEPANNANNRAETYVYYKDKSSGMVDYTICRVQVDGKNYCDSVCYLHDESKRLVKMVYYNSSDEYAYYQYHVDDFVYDAGNNLIRVGSFAINNGILYVCGGAYYNTYDTYINPLYSRDEVRILKNVFGDGNTSANNYTNMNNNYIKRFTYRADRRPASCEVSYNGKLAYDLKYFYK